MKLTLLASLSDLGDEFDAHGGGSRGLVGEDGGDGCGGGEEGLLVVVLDGPQLGVPDGLRDGHALLDARLTRVQLSQRETGG